ncbi:hypothetical protein PHMEG_0009572 [Phytophthora megakarya]|uniref:Cyclic nucleotide-binding domain-containing protein n=1 Tax=Phytophthora megakarya TaxID=4795 RepID=A0A225WFV8_9STRA|nr:hypothetical protein PHMEG_0009572 [Phytophthora megakarya]
MVTSVKDDRKCDHPLLPAEMPANIRAKVAKIMQERGNKEKISVEIVDPKAPWHQQLEQHVARLMQQMRSHPQQFRQILLMAASEANADCIGTHISMQGFVDYRKAYRRLRRAAMTLGEEIFFVVRAFVRRSEANGVLPHDAQVVRLASLYKLELRRHVTYNGVMDCIREAESNQNITKDPGNNKPGSKNKRAYSLLRRRTKSASVTSRGSNDLDSPLSARAASAPADAPGRGGITHQNTESDKIKSVHAFKLQALERLLATSWQSNKTLAQNASVRSFQTVAVSPTKLSDEILAQIQERVTAFLYHKSRENYPLWSEPPLSREETARHLRALVATFFNTPLLQGLSIEQLLEIARSSRWQTLAPGETLCVQNAEIESLIILMEGSIVSTDSTSGPSNSATVVSAPSCLGEIGMVRNSERWSQTLTAQSPEEVKVLTLPRLTFEALLHRFFNGGKAVPSAFAAVTTLVQPRRPSSSPAVHVVAKRLARTVRGSLTGRRPSTAAPTIATEANIARWHEIRDEKLRDYHAGLEAEERAAALEALERAMEELPSSEDEDFLQHLTGVPKPNTPWSRHENYPSSGPTSKEDRLQTSFESVDTAQPNSSPRSDTNTQEIVPGSDTETAAQLRDYYQTLNARRSVMKSRLALSAPSDQIVQHSPERKPSCESLSEIPSTNQQDEPRPVVSTQARQSALQLLLSKQSIVTMARHSTLLDKETAQHIIIQKHFADTPTQDSAPGTPKSRPHSAQTQLAASSRPHSAQTQLPASSRPHSAQTQLNPSHSSAPLPLRADLQRRMDSVLNDLQLSSKFKLDLVLKYTHVNHYDQFPMAVQLWECAQGAVAWRERVMKTLWDFEMLASDPRRHFRSISTQRLREEKERDAHFIKLNEASTACLEAMDELMRCCGDTLSFGERSYREKMKKDYTELLYEVEQERLRIIYSGVRPDNKNHSPKLVVDGANTDPSKICFSLATPRESIYVPISSLKIKRDEVEQPIRRMSRITVQVQQQRQTEFTAFNKQLEQQQKESVLLDTKDAELPNQVIRPPEKIFVAPSNDAQKSAARLKQQQERASLRELFEQFITRSKS